MTNAKELVAATDAAIGMFVVELDRPWLETPFLLQGFLVEDDETLAKIRSVSRFVYIDRSRSIGEHHAGATPAHRERRAKVATIDRSDPSKAEERRRKLPGFLELIRQIRNGEIDHDTARALAGGDGENDARECLVEEELVRVSPDFTDATLVIDQVLADVSNNVAPDIMAVLGCVDAMRRSIARNPDALLWLVRLKRSDGYSYRHALDVSVHMMVFARALALDEDTVSLLGMVGMLQDVGKLKLPENVLKSTGILTPLQMEIAKTHVDFSLKILAESAGAKSELLQIIQRHHERVDGSGYPAQLVGREIGLHGEMAGLVDSYCAMITERPHGKLQSTQTALAKLVRLRDVKFSAAVVDGFIQCVGLYPVGTMVELNSGEVAVVIAQNRVRRLKPRVVVLCCADKTPHRYPPTLDLLYDPKTPTGESYAITRAVPVGSFGIDPAEYYLS